MGLTTDLDDVRHVYGLCFVRAPWAYFTRLPLDQQWGDGWERGLMKKMPACLTTTPRGRS